MAYYYSYWWDPYLDYPLYRRFISPLRLAEASRLRDINWRIRRLELCNWAEYEVPPPIRPSIRYLDVVDRAQLPRFWRDLLVEYPRFSKRLLDTEVKPGHNAYLEVRAHGSPDLRVKFYKNGQPLVETSNVYVTHYRPDAYVLTIRDALTSDRGLYSCIATNIVGEATTSARVDVVRPKAPDTSVTFYDKLYDL